MGPTFRILLCLACAAPSAALSLSSTEIRLFLEGLDAGAEPHIAGAPLHNPQRVSAFYRSHEHAPLWTAGGPMADQRAALVRAIESSTRHGFNAADYHYDVLLRGEADDALQALATELLASDAFIQQVRHRTAGAVSPRDLDPDWHFIPSEVDPLLILERVLERRDALTAVLEALWPQTSEYQDLVDHRARILALGELEVEPVPPGPVLKPGHGAVGPATLEVLNAGRFSWIDRLDANLERWRWLPREVPDTYVRVNIASYTLRVIRRGEDALRMDVVGRPYRRTPVFTETIKYLVVNPYWNVPHRIAVEDKLPQLKDDPAAQEALGFQARRPRQDAFLPVTAIDCSGQTRTLHLRTPLPTFMVYFTAFTDASGEVVFRRDLYQRDAAVVAALRS